MKLCSNFLVTEIEIKKTPIRFTAKYFYYIIEKTGLQFRPANVAVRGIPVNSNKTGIDSARSARLTRWP